MPDGWDKFSRLGPDVDPQQDSRSTFQSHTIGGYGVPGSLQANMIDWPVVTELPANDDDLVAGGVLLVRHENGTNNPTYTPYMYDYDENVWAAWKGCAAGNQFTVSNYTEDFEYDADSTSVDELADVLATYITNGCGGEAVSAGLVQGLNYDYFEYQAGSNTSLTATSRTELDSTNLKLTLDCDGTHPVLLYFSCVAQAGTSDIVEWMVFLDGVAYTASDAQGRFGYLSANAGVVGTSYWTIIPAADLSAGSHDFTIGYSTAGINAGTMYGSANNWQTGAAIELKTVEGQIVQAKVDNRTQHLVSRITDWDNRPTSPTDTELIIFNPSTDVGWTMQYDEANDYWLCVGGMPWTQYRYGGLSNGNSSYATLASETLSFASMPGGDYVFQLGFYYEANTTNSYVGMTVLGDVNTEALSKASSTNGSGNASVQAQKTITDGQTVVPHWVRTSGSCTVYRAHMSMTPRHLDN